MLCHRDRSAMCATFFGFANVIVRTGDKGSSEATSLCLVGGASCMCACSAGCVTSCSYKRVKGRSHTVEKRKASHPLPVVGLRNWPTHHTETISRPIAQLSPLASSTRTFIVCCVCPPERETQVTRFGRRQSVRCMKHRRHQVGPVPGIHTTADT